MELVEVVRMGPRDVSRIRHTLADRLHDWGVQEDSNDVAVLLTSELVTNALRHGDSPVLLHAVLADLTLVIAVDDAGPAPVATVEVAWDSTGGRGLHLVEALANRWGVDVREVGKRVWFELVLPA